MRLSEGRIGNKHCKVNIFSILNENTCRYVKGGFRGLKIPVSAVRFCPSAPKKAYYFKGLTEYSVGPFLFESTSALSSLL